MMRLQVPRSVAASFIVIAMCAIPLAAAESPCELNYRTDGTTAETFVLTGLTPQAVVERLPWLLTKAGVKMQWAQPTKGIIKAEGLDVNAEKSGDATRVTFRSLLQPPADRRVLCQYASLVGSPPEATAAPIAQDRVLIERMKNDLLKRRAIVQQTGGGLNNVQFSSLSNFLQFAVTGIHASAEKQEYRISMLLPRSVCGIAREDMDDLMMQFSGKATEPRTRPVRVEASLVYEGEGAASHLTEASIITIESTK